MEEHLVRVHLPSSGTDNVGAFNEIMDCLGDAVERSGAGELDGNEVGESEYTIWLYGTDGSKLLEVVRRALATKNVPHDSYLFVRHGAADDQSAHEETIRL